MPLHDRQHWADAVRRPSSQTCRVLDAADVRLETDRWKGLLHFPIDIEQTCFRYIKSNYATGLKARDLPAQF